jgi:predicted acylesterase/phospholipase RssA
MALVNLKAAKDEAQRIAALRRPRDILLASAGIPGAFPPREVDGQLFVDGGTTSNIIYGGALGREETFGATWKRLYPGQPIPKLRYWVIINNYGVSIPRTIQEGWPEIITRSLELSIRYSTLTSLRHLFALAEVTQLRGDGETEVRWTSIPDSWRPVNKGDFDEATMRSLSDLGRKRATEPGTWSSVSP